MGTLLTRSLASVGITSESPPPGCGQLELLTLLAQDARASWAFFCFIFDKAWREFFPGVPLVPGL